MFGFGKKKEDKIIEDINDKDISSEKVPSGMKETIQRMMSGSFNMNDMLGQLKQIKKINNFLILVLSGSF